MEQRTEKARRYYLAYGSNLNILQMKRRCPSARIIGTAVIPDHRLLFKGSKTGSFLTIEPAEDSSVPVGVWEVSPEDEAALDRYEGCPIFYYKRALTLPIRGIRTGKVRIRNAFVYIMHEERPYGLPTRFYMDVCREGYEDFGFDSELLEEAFMYSLEQRASAIRRDAHTQKELKISRRVGERNHRPEAESIGEEANETA